MALEALNKAPNFTALTDEGKEAGLSKYLGKWVVLYFYPKDNTSGCTTEACDFRDNMARITRAGAVVLGVSPDSVKSHDGFKDKFNLNLSLISDTDKSICKAYDVLGEKSMYGKKFIGVIRTTYIIDDKGLIRYVDPKVSVEGHVDDIINKLKELKKK